MTCRDKLKSNFNYARLIVFTSLKLSASFNIDSLNTQPQYMTIHKRPVFIWVHEMFHSTTSIFLRFGGKSNFVFINQLSKYLQNFQFQWHFDIEKPTICYHYKKQADSFGHLISN